MTTVSSTPTIWTPTELAILVKDAVEAFVDRRLGESSDRFPKHVKMRRKGIIELLRHLRDIDPSNPDPHLVQRMLAKKGVFDSLRYLAGPPISADDLGVLVTRGAARITKTAIAEDPGLAVDIFKLVLRLIDRGRFPWIAKTRSPRLQEVKTAILTTASLHASQSMQTERRAYGKAVEELLVADLVKLGYTKVMAKNRGVLTVPVHFPAPATFYGECRLHGRRADLIIGLHDGRIVAVESKDSSSVVNSVKRVLNDTAAKAKMWHSKMGDMAVPVALLSGVFGYENLIEAQKQGLFLVWSHNLDDFTRWLKAMHPTN